MEAAEVIPLAMSRLKRLKMPPPPANIFEDLLGLSGNARFFALHWSRPVQAPILSDGGIETVGSQIPYRTWRHHRKVIAALAGYDLGDGGEGACHWLLVDRKLRTLHIGTAAEVKEILEYQRRGVIPPLTEAGKGVGEEAPPGGGAEAMIVSRDRFRRLVSVSVRRIHELQDWIEGNVGR